MKIIGDAGFTDAVSTPLTSAPQRTSCNLWAVTNWGDATWQLSTDSTFTNNVQSATAPLTATGIQQGPSSFTLQPDTQYYVRVSYAAADPAGQSIYSNANAFKTGTITRTAVVDDRDALIDALQEIVGDLRSRILQLETDHAAMLTSDAEESQSTY